MSQAPIIFLGAGQANVVVDLPITDIPSAPAELRTSVATQRAALRIRKSVHKECAECYRALEAYAGSRHIVPLEAPLYKAIERVVPPKFHALIDGATEATIVPNFTSDPAQLLRLDLTAGEDPSRVADYTVEVKPKSAWQPPRVVGIVVDGTAYHIDELKHRHCRYKQMLSFKAERDAHKKAPSHDGHAAGAPQEPVPPYCPNYLFHPSLSSRDGLRRLLSNAQNNLKVVSYYPSRAAPPHLDPKSLTASEVHGIADALDVSGVLVPLSHLQLFGCAPAVPGEAADAVAARSVPVLDIELLYRWSLAKDKSSVEWVVLPDSREDFAALCSCFVEGDACTGAAQRSSEAAERRVKPLLDFDTCVERFYVSTTAKDVSLMVAVSSRRGELDDTVPCTRVTGVSSEIGGVFVQRGVDVYRVGAVDLDDKKHKALSHYYEHDHEIMDAFKRQNQH